MICFFFNSDPDSEWYSVSFSDDSSSKLFSEDFDMASFQGSGMVTGDSCSFVPLKYVLVGFQIRIAVNRMGETILAQVCCLRYDRGYRQ